MVRVKRCGKSAPAPRVTGVARQTPPEARPRRPRREVRPRRRSRVARPSLRVGRSRHPATVCPDGWSPLRVSGYRRRAEQNPAYRPTRPPQPWPARDELSRAVPSCPLRLPADAELDGLVSPTCSVPAASARPASAAGTPTTGWARTASTTPRSACLTLPNRLSCRFFRADPGLRYLPNLGCPDPPGTVPLYRKKGERAKGLTTVRPKVVRSSSEGGDARERFNRWDGRAVLYARRPCPRRTCTRFRLTYEAWSPRTWSVRRTW